MGRNPARGNRQRQQVNWIRRRYADAWKQAAAPLVTRALAYLLDRR